MEFSEFLTLVGTHALAVLAGLIVERTSLRPIGRLCDFTLKFIGILGDKADEELKK